MSSGIAQLVLTWAGVFVAMLIVVVRETKNRRSKDSNDRWAGWIVTVLALLAAGLSGYMAWEQKARSDRLEALIPDARIAEASGGAIGPDGMIYVVDDDRPQVFSFKRNGRKYDFDTFFRLCHQGYQLADDDVDDLEGAAVADGKLYLVTSHSNTKKGKPKPERQLLLEVSLDPATKGQVIRASNLRGALDQALFLGPDAVATPAFEVDHFTTDRTETHVEVEGLAIGPCPPGGATSSATCIYLGLRAPQDRAHHAMVLHTELARVLAPPPAALPAATGACKPRPATPAKSRGAADEDKAPRIHGSAFNPSAGVFHVSPLSFDDPEKDRLGVVALDYDTPNGQLCMLTNDMRRDESTDASAWCVKLCPYGGLRSPTKVLEHFFRPEMFEAKPEALMLTPEGDLMVTFLDAPGGGGQHVVPLKPGHWWERVIFKPKNWRVAAAPSCAGPPPATPAT